MTYYLIYPILMVLNLLNVALHTIGTCALISLYTVSQERSQRMFLINHSICECTRHLLEIVMGIPDLISLPSDHAMRSVNSYIEIAFISGICVVYYLAMVYVTLDRLAKIVLHVRYKHYWDINKTKKLIACTWLSGLVMCVVSTITSTITTVEWDKIFHRYIYPVTDILFITFSVATLTLIIRKYNRQKRMLIKRRGKKQFNRLAVTRDKKKQYLQFKGEFLVPACLIVTFLIFITLPDLIYFIVCVIENNQSSLLKIAIWISYAVAAQIDACFYLFFLPDVRRLLVQKCCAIKSCCCWDNRPGKRNLGRMETGLGIELLQTKFSSNLEISVSFEEEVTQVEDVEETSMHLPCPSS